MLTATRSLDAWLERIERLHPSEIELGLDRIAAVRDRLPLAMDFPVILVGGTNGKGSVCAVLESIYHSAGFVTGLYTSPHLLAYNERVRVDGHHVDDAELVAAFEQVEAARGEIPLTYFEFGTLAAALMFRNRSVDVAILEVGLGGRLDAVNVFEPACSVVVSVDVDHVDYLGDNREAIGFEKAGIFRPGLPAVCGDEDPPASLLKHASAIGAQLHLIGRDFGHVNASTGWQFWNAAGKMAGLPMPGLRGAPQLDNAAAALECVRILHPVLPVQMAALRNGLLDASVMARFQVLATSPPVILDVAHNPGATRALSTNLQEMPCAGRTLAVFGVLQDKDIGQIVSVLARQVDHWFACGLGVARGAPAGKLGDTIAQVTGKDRVETFDNVANGLAAARDVARDSDRILVFGSFYTVSEALKSSEALRTLARC
ncbi:MAG: bifunctional tetrahydrofolate synthase/dihydrofolate synthase [Burkholderiales bacterium]|jgi:dihydrofolate synthase/folylpolyglutamate synthase